jgi:hypothetical protein
MKFHPDVGPERNLTAGEKFNKKKNQPSVFNNKRNPLFFVVPWQLSDEQDV